ncbi:ABC transporter ATP-binding protein [Planctomicrobium sp. SH664]|uniref:ABC transporter ATP-binding protein n=1 Tax=Planctomicrobium sp. SH664 TaxID=3448125 RepID=UPI003F5C58FD
MIDLQQATIRAGDFSLSKISFSVRPGAYVVLMGRSGTGKTTLLEAICGLRPIESGKLLIAGKEMTRSSPAARQVGYVPQDLALFATMSVHEHLEFALRIRSIPRPQREQRVRELATLLGVEPLLSRPVTGLSGGEAQRVALGRALSFSPRVLLLDEPLSAVDEETRGDLQQLLRDVQKKTQVTVLHVTHSRDEARALGDELWGMDDGQITPLTLT